MHGQEAALLLIAHLRMLEESHPIEDPTPYMETVELGTLIIKTFQEYLCIKSIQALAKQPETFSWRLLLDSHLFSHQLLALLFCPGSNPIIKDAKAGSAIGLSENEQHTDSEEQIL